MAQLPVAADDLRAAFIEAATWHGTLEGAEAILAAHPEIATGSVHAAAVLGDDVTVRRHLEADPANATAKAGPHGGDALNYLCLSKYLRLHGSRSDGFLRAATALLDAGADPNTGFWTTGQYPERETALYGAAGVAHHAAMTRLLLVRGADPNDEEAVYHSPEGRDLGAMQALVETGKVTAENLVMMLIRKHDWHDGEGVKWLLEHGANPDSARQRGWLPIHHAIARDNDVEIIELLLDHGADVTVREDGLTAIARAARRGRGDLLGLFERRGIPIALAGVDRLLAACARNDAAGVADLAAREPDLVRELLAQGGARLAEFTNTWNVDGVRHLLDLGVPADTRYEGDGYFNIAEQSTALHVAAWGLCTDLVRLLLERGVPVDATDGKGRTALQLAVKACVDSYWTEARTPEPARALLDAGANASGITLPTGYDAMDDLLRAHGRS